MVAVLQEILVMPKTPTSLIGLLVEKLIGLLRDETQKIQMVSLCVTVRLLKNQCEIVSVYSSQIEHVFLFGCVYISGSQLKALRTGLLVGPVHIKFQTMI